MLTSYTIAQESDIPGIISIQILPPYGQLELGNLNMARKRGTVGLGMRPFTLSGCT